MKRKLAMVGGRGGRMCWSLTSFYLFDWQSTGHPAMRKLLVVRAARHYSKPHLPSPM